MGKAQKEEKKKDLHYASPLRTGIFLRHFYFYFFDLSYFILFSSLFYSYSYFAEFKIGPPFI